MNDETTAGPALRVVGGGRGAGRTVWVVNGPNLGRLGSREPDIYGRVDAEELARRVAAWGGELGLDVTLKQSDDEATVMGWIHEAADRGIGVVLNPAAFTHYSYGLRDAVADLTARGGVLVEIHISNPSSRETFRHTSVISGVATGTIAGFGLDSYRLALSALAAR
ncbi:MAG: 3-dehydroquinate dehydratase [Bifidobacteriaceae bacterium]|jgi:3-dehydroquinate dehydratase-2|nr:3-dehydroquinate dehydratase [Bifidobacteriaceae bacterium]